MPKPKKSLKNINSRGFSGALLYPLVVAIFILTILAIPLISYAAPGVPYNVSVDRFSASSSALTVSWNNIGFGAGSGNRIWMNGRVTSIATTATNATYNVTGLSPGVNYVFKIGAYDNTGYSDYSFPAAAITKTSAASTSFQMPHASFMDSSNMCSACHSVHKARTKFKALKFRYSNMTTEYSTSESTTTPAQLLPGVTLCFNCHDGQGAQYNAKKFYDQPTSAAVPWPGHMTRRDSTTATEASFGGWRYMSGQPKGQRQPCMICHDVHVSSKGNWKSLADDLVNYAVTTNSNNRWLSTGGWNSGSSIASDAGSVGVVDVGTNANEKCVVCHHDNSRVNGIMRVAGRDLSWPNSLNGTPAGEYPPGDPTSKNHAAITGQTFNCGCHVGASTNDQNNVHALSNGSEPTTTQSNCGVCHDVLEQRMMSSSITSRHYISQSTDNKIPEAGTCVSKCHNNHPRNDNTHAANVYENAPLLAAGGSAAYDYNKTTGEGLCLSCHKNVQQSFRPGGTSNSTAFISAINTQGFSQTSHNFESTGFGPTHFTPTKFTGNCIKCHRDNSNDQYSQWGPHASSNRSLLVLPSASANLPAGSSERLCYNCHSNNSSSGYERMWAGGQIATVAWKISQAFSQNPTWGHSSYLNSTSVDRHRASEGYTASWVQGWMMSSARHVECYDCHNPHQASQSYNYRAALPLLSSANDSRKDLEAPTKGYVSGPLRGVWGVSPTQNWGSIATAANYYSTTYNAASPVNTLFYTASASKQVYICLKCHSAYAYGTAGANRPNIPSGVPVSNYGGTPESNLGAGRQSNILADFNPNNIGYHPIFSPGRNQPSNAANPNWSGANGRNSVAYDTPGQPPGLTTAFVPPWGGSSLVTCSDCHSHQSSSYSRGYYTSAANLVNNTDTPRGPHGSSRRWILRKVDRSIQYRRNNNTWYVYNASLGTDSGRENNYFCLNCHRADVYWGGSGSAAPVTGIARVNHIPGNSPGGRTQHNVGSYNTWGIACMSCHGGQTIGTIHGTGGAPQAYGTYTLGRRLIYGAVWEGYSWSGSTISCYTKNNTDFVTNCTQHGGGGAGTASEPPNYTY